MTIMESYIRIDGWKSNIRFSAAHIIPEYEKCGRLHGHSYAIHAKIYGQRDEKGIIIDFSVVKRELRDIANHLDHYILIPGKNPSISITKSDDQISLTFQKKTYVFPSNDCLILPILSTSAENISLYILETVYKKIKDDGNITKIEIGVDEGYGQGGFVSKQLNR